MVRLKEEEKKQAVQEKQVLEHKEKKAENKSKSEKNKEVKESVKPVIIKTHATLADLEVLLYPLVTEKAVGMIESQNKITFIVNDNASKPEIKKRVEEAYEVKVREVNIIRDMKGRKKAIVKLDKAFKASELATKLGVL
jgi:ribosomal protein uL23